MHTRNWRKHKFLYIINNFWFFFIITKLFECWERKCQNTYKYLMRELSYIKEIQKENIELKLSTLYILSKSISLMIEDYVSFFFVILMVLNFYDFYMLHGVCCKVKFFEIKCFFYYFNNWSQLEKSWEILISQ